MADHWYDKDAKPMHTIVGKNGKDRNTTVRDARKLGLVPSVTTILGLMSDSGLEHWKRTEVCKAAFETSPSDTAAMGLKEYTAHIIALSGKKGREAREFGTEIHLVIEHYLKTQERMDYFENIINRFIIPIYDFLDAADLKGTSEGAKVFELNGLKYAGTIDYYDDECIKDYKTQSTKDGKFTIYPKWLYQLSGYNVHLKRKTAKIIMISSTEPGLIKEHVYSWEDMKRGQVVFESLLKAFYYHKGLV